MIRHTHVFSLKILQFCFASFKWVNSSNHLPKNCKTYKTTMSNSVIIIGCYRKSVNSVSYHNKIWILITTTCNPPLQPHYKNILFQFEQAIVCIFTIVCSQIHIGEIFITQVLFSSSLTFYASLLSTLIHESGCWFSPVSTDVNCYWLHLGTNLWPMTNVHEQWT